MYINSDYTILEFLVIKTCMHRVKVKIIQKYTVLMKWVKGVV